MMTLFLHISLLFSTEYHYLKITAEPKIITDKLLENKIPEGRKEYVHEHNGPFHYRLEGCAWITPQTPWTVPLQARGVRLDHAHKHHGPSHYRLEGCARITPTNATDRPITGSRGGVLLTWSRAATHGTRVAVEHARVASLVSARVHQAALLGEVKGQLAGGTHHHQLRLHGVELLDDIHVCNATESSAWSAP